MRILVTDCVFPSRFSSWRNNEVNYLLARGADLLVFKVDSFAGQDYTLDWEFANRSGALADYNIFIFDPRYNQLDRYNTRIDGRKFNGAIAASYAISKDRTFNPNSYDCVYHIFFNCFRCFCRVSHFPTSRQCIHLYPGGGFSPATTRTSQLGRAAVVATHPITSDWLQNCSTLSVECWTGPFYQEGEVLIPRSPRVDQGPLVISFASMGQNAEKGTHTLSQIAAICQQRRMNVEFVVIGGQGQIPFVRRMPVMSYIELEHFYRNNVAVHLNLDTGVAFNGWPLGIEAAKHGVALVTTDPSSVSSRYYKHFDTLPLVAGSVDAVIEHLEVFCSSPTTLAEESARSHAFALHWGDVPKQQDVVIEFLEFIASRKRSVQIHMADAAASAWGRFRRRAMPKPMGSVARWARAWIRRIGSSS